MNQYLTIHTEPEPHNHSHRIRGLTEASLGRADFNMFHNDEAFERYEMGGHQRPHSGGHNKSEEMAQNRIKSIKMSASNSAEALNF